jgi:hypothetical protein
LEARNTFRKLGNPNRMIKSCSCEPSPATDI